MDDLLIQLIPPNHRKVKIADRLQQERMVLAVGILDFKGSGKANLPVPESHIEAGLK